MRMLHSDYVIVISKKDPNFSLKGHITDQDSSGFNFETFICNVPFTGYLEFQDWTVCRVYKN